MPEVFILKSDRSSRHGGIRDTRPMSLMPFYVICEDTGEADGAWHGQFAANATWLHSGEEERRRKGSIVTGIFKGLIPALVGLGKVHVL